MDPNLEEKVRQIVSRYEEKSSSTSSSSPTFRSRGFPSTSTSTSTVEEPEIEPNLPLLADEEFPSWTDKELFDYFSSIGIYFMPAKGSNQETMKECFTILVHRKGVLFHRVLHGDRIIEPLRVISASRLLDPGDVGICLTHDEYGRPVKYLEAYTTCKEDWLVRHCQDEDLRTQVLRDDEN